MSPWLLERPSASWPGRWVRLADRARHAPLVLATITAAAAIIGMGYIPVRGLVLLTVVVVAHAAVLAPLMPIGDALALGSSQGPSGFPYGWVRGAGSAAFIVGTVVSGQYVASAGLGVIIWLNVALLAVAASLAGFLPNRVAGTSTNSSRPAQRGSIFEILHLKPFLWMMGAVALIGGSHAMHDGFEVIRWQSAGLSSMECSILWALSVAAEVVVFVGIGPKLLTVSVHPRSYRVC